MAIKYKIINKGQPGVKGGGKRCLSATVVYNKTISQEEFEEIMTKRIRFSRADVIAFLKTMEQVLIDGIKEGNIVKTSFLGTFYPSVRKKGEIAGNIKDKEHIKCDINFRPALELKKEIRKAEVKRVERKRKERYG